MFSKLVSVVLLTALAGRAVAQTVTNFTVTIGPDTKRSTTVMATEVLNFNVASFPVISSCDGKCKAASGAIAACAAAAANDSACYCASTTTAPLQDCETCMFEALVIANKPMPLPLAGSNQVLTGWTLNCANQSHPLATPLGLSVSSPNLIGVWDGPFDSVFPDAVGWVIAVTGGLLGSSLIYMLCQM
ncbi:hypothetical protein DFH08DRAFT_803519 [Mycena albidolilacea]|uniref:Uncharacterized protein n=1 Tax=Mycena albidolilacea TaxID=1033008 RepID=A0AAD7AD34_9AGAR|nr:hypothetical protein DFH08DRAFT_803519 [Mycena albidolilacea]